AGRITGRGRVSRLTVMRPPAGDAVTLPAPGDILWMEGDVVREGNESSVVLHALVALPDGSVAGGRVAEATADSFEITIEESPLLPPRVVDPGTGGAFVDLSAGEERRGPDGRATSGVDEVVEDSFPASDPPSFAGVPSD
ncbi:MAG TPA: hypothetical protein VM841_15105, partial [Actinomycetota bacterium]|nr:hypothetical protein [Actinomycetota bacterium]